MIRVLALLFAAVTVLAGAGQAQAQERGFFDIFGGGGPNFGGGGYGGSSPIQRVEGRNTSTQAWVASGSERSPA